LLETPGEDALEREQSSGGKVHAVREWVEREEVMKGRKSRKTTATR
jgi:hypothetical protein